MILVEINKFKHNKLSLARKNVSNEMTNDLSFSSKLTK